MACRNNDTLKRLILSGNILSPDEAVIILLMCSRTHLFHVCCVRCVCAVCAVRAVCAVCGVVLEAKLAIYVYTYSHVCGDRWLWAERRGPTEPGLSSCLRASHTCKGLQRLGGGTFGLVSVWREGFNFETFLLISDVCLLMCVC